MHSFLGLCTHYCRFVAGFATIVVPLYHLTRNGTSYECSGESQQTFVALNRALVAVLVLPHPQYDLPNIADTDASQKGVGAVLSQLRDGKNYVLAYQSAKFTKAERNYCVTRKELTAVMKTLVCFQHYLYDTRFIIRTNHATLRRLKATKEPEEQLARWIGNYRSITTRSIIDLPGYIAPPTASAYLAHLCVCTARGWSLRRL